MRKLLFLSFLFFSTYSFSQDTIYLDQAYKPVPNKESAEHFKLRERNKENPDAGVERSFYKSGQLKLEEPFSSFTDRIREGKRKLWREEGSLWTEQEYADNRLDGYWISYWENGRLKRKDFYQEGKLIQKEVWDKAGNEVEWYPAEQPPQFPGGKRALIDYLKQNQKRPKGVNGGRVVVRFVIDVDGSITDVSIVESTNIELNMAAYNMVANMPSWKPGKQDGNPVRIIRTIPLTFPK